MRLALIHHTIILTIASALAASACDDGMCKIADLAPPPDGDYTLCQTHPFGPEPYCGGVEEPQTEEWCVNILLDNPGLCEGDYVVCRDELRAAPCGVCPDSCMGIEGACPGWDSADSGLTL